MSFKVLKAHSALITDDSVLLHCTAIVIQHSALSLKSFPHSNSFNPALAKFFFTTVYYQLAFPIN